MEKIYNPYRVVADDERDYFLVNYPTNINSNIDNTEKYQKITRFMYSFIRNRCLKNVCTIVEHSEQP